MNKPRNLGEQNEVFLKTFLLKAFHEKTPLLIDGQLKTIDSLSFGPNTKLPVWKSEYAVFLANRDYDSLKGVFPKAPTNYKADVEINRERFSVKFLDSAKPAIVNHTSRAGFLNVCKKLGISIDTLDKAVGEYWLKRESGEITEDISNANPKSPFAKYKEYLTPILEYFLFDGTGSKDSAFPADKVLAFSNPTDPATYRIYSREDVISQIWGTLVFSIRSKKGMPSRYSPDVYPDLVEWVRYRPGDEHPKGALHIRT